jgi:hypothetical protein
LGFGAGFATGFGDVRLNDAVPLLVRVLGMNWTATVLTGSWFHPTGWLPPGL